MPFGNFSRSLAWAVRTAWVEQRYFRRNEGTTDYATIPEVTLAGDFVIEFDVQTSVETFHVLSNSALNMRIFQSAASNKVEITTDAGVTNFTGLFPQGVVSKAKFSRVSGAMSLVVNDISLPIATGGTNSGVFTIDQIYNKMGKPTSVPIMGGIIANLKIYDNGTLIRDYPINDNSSTIRDLANGQDGTIINGNADDWGLFDRQADGDWLGEELWPHEADANTVEGHATFSVLANGQGLPVTVGATYRAYADFSIQAPRLQWVLGYSGDIISNSSTYSEDILIETYSNNFIRTIDDTAEGVVSGISLREVLKSA